MDETSAALPDVLPDPDPDTADEDSCSSDLSDVSGTSGSEWRPCATPIRWVQKQIEKGSLTPREILEQLLPNTSIPTDCDNVTLWRLIVSILSQPPKRKRLSHVNTLDDVVALIRRSRRIIVLTGAGVSVSCGIPDFRSRDGVYARLSVEFPSLPDPQSMFDIHYFRRDPRPFFKFAKEIYPGQFEPSASHKFIRMIESHGKLLRNYTQNIDTLEEVCGLQRVINCHGSFSTASCTRCGLRVRADQIKEDIFSQRIPLCPQCPSDDCGQMAVMKPDIVFFGEGLSDEFHNAMAADKDQCDLLLVMGSSLKVRPVALIPSSISSDVPQILINREPLNHMNFDVELLGDCDVIVQELSNR
jgi:NAD-dependent deacetylase sirtuin 1